MSDTADLVERVRGGDREAFGLLYDQHARLVRAICYDATAHLPSAEDLTHDAFVKAYEKLHQLRDGAMFLPWLCEIARRLGRDWRRASQRAGPWAAAVDVACARSAEESRVAELRDAIRQLPDDERLALHLFYLEEQPAAAARQTLGLSQSGFYKLLDRAREHAGQIMRRNHEAMR
jgi:RNA polymerase sigma-70 factor, ECF subfamily